MSVANQALIYNIGLIGTPIIDGMQGLAAGTQGNATRLSGELHRSVQGAAGASYQLPSIISGEAGAPLAFFVNDGPNSQTVFCWPGEKMNGAINGSLAVPAGQCAIFIRVTLPLGGPEWRSNTFS